MQNIVIMWLLGLSLKGFPMFWSLTIFWVIILRNSGKSIVPDPSLSMSATIFLISSFFGSNPRALMATCGATKVGLSYRSDRIGSDLHGKQRAHLQLLHIDRSGSIRVKQIKRLLYFLFLLLGQFSFVARFLPLACRRNGFTGTWSLQT